MTVWGSRGAAVHPSYVRGKAGFVLDKWPVHRGANTETHTNTYRQFGVASHLFGPLWKFLLLEVL